jgi:methyl-accepting chemotaxis protein
VVILKKQGVKDSIRSLGSSLSTTGEASKKALAFLRNNPVKSVGLKLYLMFFVSILVFVVATGSISYFVSKNVIEDKVAEAQVQTITQATEKLDILYNTFEELTMQLISDAGFTNEITKYYNLEPNSYEFLQTRIAIENTMKTMSNNKSLSALSLYDANGTPIYLSSNNNTENRLETEWFKKIRAGNAAPIWLEAGTGIYNHAGTSFAVGREIRSLGGSPVILLIEIKMSILENELKNVNLGNNSEVFIATPQGKIVYSQIAEQIEADASVKIENTDVKSFTITDSDKVERLVVFHTSAKNGWNLIGTVPVSELVKDARTIAQFTVWISIIASLFAAGIGYIIVRMVAHPLVELRNLMKEGERGNLTVRTKVRSSDEIGQLGESFNQMMSQITLLAQQTTHSAQEVLNTSAELTEASRKTALAAKEIAIATEEIASGASSLAVEAERGNDITSNIGDQMKEVVEANTEMSEAAAVVQSASVQGTEYMAELIGKTNVTEEMTRSLMEKVDKLKESTRSIRKILDLLNNITKQTNILSLNATIEAARAGAAGKGFMVVADEIRKLADQSRQSIDVVGQITETIQTEIDGTVSVLTEAYPLFQEQIVSVKEADEIFRQVRDEMNGFSSKLNQATESIRILDSSQNALNEAMANVSAVAQQSSATSEEVASLSSEQTSVSDGLVRLSERLDNLSKELKESLSKFTI